jgi:hypothetical protein
VPGRGDRLFSARIGAGISGILNMNLGEPPLLLRSSMNRAFQPQASHQPPLGAFLSAARVGLGSALPSAADQRTNSATCSSKVLVTTPNCPTHSSASALSLPYTRTLIGFTVPKKRLELFPRRNHLDVLHNSVTIGKGE